MSELTLNADDAGIKPTQLLKHLTKSSLAMLKNRGGVELGAGQSRARAVISDIDFPKQVDVVVIGAGNIGCMTALNLVERGLTVALLEKGVVAGESSGRSLGYIETLFADPAKVEMVARAKILWEHLHERVSGHTGYVRTGSVTGFLSNEGVEAAQGWLDAVRGMPSVSARVISKEELKEKTSNWNEDFVAGLYEPTDACAEPQHFAPSVAEAFREKGGKLFQNCAVKEVLTKGGRISGVVTERGEIKCQSVVLTGGVWTSYLAKSLGLDLPQFMAFASVGRVATQTFDIENPSISQKHPLISDSGIAIRHSGLDSVDVCAPAVRMPVTATMLKNLPKLGGAMVAMEGQFEPVFDINTLMFEYKHMYRYQKTDQSPLQQYRVLAPKVFEPPLLDAVKRYASLSGDQDKTLQESWAGILMTTLDHMPYLSAIDMIPGFYVGSGFYNGLTVAPAAGEALADLVMHQKPKIDLTLYRYDRFKNGQPIVFRN